jgi:hypothetical protein
MDHFFENSSMKKLYKNIFYILIACIVYFEEEIRLNLFYLLCLFPLDFNTLGR